MADRKTRKEMATANHDGTVVATATASGIQQETVEIDVRIVRTTNRPRTAGSRTTPICNWLKSIIVAATTREGTLATSLETVDF